MRLFWRYQPMWQAAFLYCTACQLWDQKWFVVSYITLQQFIKHFVQVYYHACVKTMHVNMFIFDKLVVNYVFFLTLMKIATSAIWIDATVVFVMLGLFPVSLYMAHKVTFGVVSAPCKCDGIQSRLTRLTNIPRQNHICPCGKGDI